MAYILIILFWGGAARADHIEFATKEACLFAAQQTQVYLAKSGVDHAFCVPKG